MGIFVLIQEMITWKEKSGLIWEKVLPYYLLSLVIYSSLDSKNSIYLLVYAFHMPIFWIISGMLLSGKDYNNVSMLENNKKESKIHNVSLCNIQFNYSSLQLHRFEFELGVKKPV